MKTRRHHTRNAPLHINRGGTFRFIKKLEKILLKGKKTGKKFINSK